MKQSIGLVLKLIVIAIFLFSCKQSPSGAISRSLNTSNESYLNHNNFINKYNGYINFQNYFNKGIMRSARNYYKGYDPSKPVTKNNRPIIWSHSASFHTYVNNLLNNEKEKPEFAIDAKVPALFKHAKSLDSLFKLSAFYYSKKQHDEDNFKEGQELSDKLELEFLNYRKVYNSFAKDMRVLADEMVENDLKRFKKEGQMVRYNLLNTILSSDKLLAYIYKSSNQKFKDFSNDELTVLMKDFTAKLTALEKQSLDMDAVKKELGLRYSNINSFLREGANIIRSVKGLEERIEKNDWNYSRAHPTVPDSGSLEEVNKNYNNLINAYNAMN